MSKFKTGDKVRRIIGSFKGMDVGDTDVVKSISASSIVSASGIVSAPGIVLETFEGCHSASSLELANDRPHADVAIHYFKGGDVDYRSHGSKEWKLWTGVDAPSFYKSLQYRKHVSQSPKQNQIDELESKIAECQQLIHEIKTTPQGKE